MQSNLSMRRAKSLKKGDKIALVAPSSPFERRHFSFALDWLESMGYEPTYRKSIFSRKDYLAGTDGRRKEEFLDAVRDRSNQAVLCARGGYGAMRLFFGGLGLKRAEVPSKIFMGLSDITVLLNHIAKKHGLVTIHGPMPAGAFFSSMAEKKRRQAFSLLETGEVQELKRGKDFEPIVSGTAKGTLWGGNMALVAASLGTPCEVPSPREGILFLEEVAEPPYRVDRLMTQLALSGFLSKFQAILLGDFTDTKGKVYSKRWLKDLIQPLLPKKTPLIYGIASSHERMDVLLPIGGEVAIQPNKITLSPLVS